MSVLLSQAKGRAKDAGILFDLSPEDVEMPAVCPVLGIPLQKGDGKYCEGSPTLDRMDPSRGYVRGNVAVISFRANRLKNNGTAEEHERIAAWMRSGGAAWPPT